MSLPRLTPKNLETKLTELYALPDPALIIQAAAINVDFRWWVRQNFDLDPMQDTYLTGMNNAAVLYYGQQCSICFLWRLPITIEYIGTSAPNYGKWTDSQSSIVVGTDKNANIQVTGSFHFIFRYVPE